MTVNCLIIDDEPIARDILRNYCGHLPYLHIVAECGNALEARNVLLQEHVDLLMLDIHMPVFDGLAFLHTLKNAPQVIFTTAYKEFAINAFDLAAVDYLVKPFSLERFIVAIDRVLEILAKAPSGIGGSKPIEPFIFIKTDSKIYRLHVGEWLYSEAKGNYTKIVTADKILLPYLSFSAFEQLVSPDYALRVHRSFIVNISRISQIEGDRILIGSNEIPIGGNYRAACMKAIGL